MYICAHTHTHTHTHTCIQYTHTHTLHYITFMHAYMQWMHTYVCSVNICDHPSIQVHFWITIKPTIILFSIHFLPNKDSDNGTSFDSNDVISAVWQLYHVTYSPEKSDTHFLPNRDFTLWYHFVTIIYRSWFIDFVVLYTKFWLIYNTNRLSVCDTSFCRILVYFFFIFLLFRVGRHYAFPQSVCPSIWYKIVSTVIWKLFEILSWNLCINTKHYETTSRTQEP